MGRELAAERVDVVIRLPGELVGQLDQVARSEYRSRANMTVRLVQEGLDRRAHEVEDAP
jgi:metal-responsive CopG/Arc/MetJ family transcriptional regulator